MRTALKLIPFYYIRHGQTDWNSEGRCMGQADIPLNNQGIRESYAIKKLLNDCKIKTICHSPLSRTKQTALILNEALDCPLVEIDTLKECHWGILQGQLKGNGEYLNRWTLGETPEGAENYDIFVKRALSGINQALQHPGPVLIVGHGGIYWAIQKALGQDHILRPSLPNCGFIYHVPPLDGNGSWVVTTVDEKRDVEPYEQY